MKNLKTKIANYAQELKYDSGQAMMVAVVFFLAVSLTIIFGLVTPIIKQKTASANMLTSRQSYFLAEAGIEDVVYRLRSGMPVAPVETLSLLGGSVSIETSDTSDGKNIVAEGDINNLFRKLETNIVLGSGVSFHFGIHAGEGGLRMENTSSISGNVYSSGSVIGSGPGNNVVRGSVVSAGPTGLIDNLYSTSSAYARTIRNAEIDGDAYYQSISNTTVLGTLYPGSVDQATSSLPITDEQINDWKQIALDGGVISSPCPYKITGETTIGPIKIACDLEISGTNYTVTLMGNVWVEGNVDIKNSPTIRIDPSFGSKGVAFIADKPSSPDTSGKIILQNSATFYGSGSTGSHVMFVSQNRSAESGGSEVAIDVKNTVSGALLVYAGHGEISLQNSVNLKEVTAYRIRLKNTAEVIYETGIANLLFSSGPSGGYEILNWKEIE